MTTMPIITLPDPVLRKISTPLERVDAEVLKLADDMLETMYAAPGVGLAAVQVGVPLRLVVLDVSEEDGVKSPQVFINPEIVARSRELRLYEEGCLSIPDFRLEIERPSEITVTYIDRDGRKQQIQATGLLATALQHEIDHLEGKLIIDFLTRLKRDMVIRKFKKISRS